MTPYLLSTAGPSFCATSKTCFHCFFCAYGGGARRKWVGGHHCGASQATGQPTKRVKADSANKSPIASGARNAGNNDCGGLDFSLRTKISLGMILWCRSTVTWASSSFSYSSEAVCYFKGGDRNTHQAKKKRAGQRRAGKEKERDRP